MSELKLDQIEPIQPVARRLEGQTIILTGGGNGIGRNAVERFAAEGANVVVNDINPAVAEAVANQLCERYGKDCAMPHAGDVTEPGFNQAMVKATVERYGELDSIVCNAGVTRDAALSRMERDSWEQTIALHLTAPMELAKAALDAWRTAKDPHRRRNAVFTSSVSAFGNDGQSSYSAAKAGILGFMSTFAIECRQRYRLPRVNVNAIGYGPILTRMTQEGKQDIEVGGESISMGLPPGSHEAIQGRVLLGRMADPSEAAAGIYFLVGPDSSFFTGKVLWVDGGTFKLIRS
ncbi:MAG: SDR family oxidoreductase [Gammaproteobacteria bacterium]|nr:SDR family oxidoreductase [Gammaproteobacteria bacterium]